MLRQWVVVLLSLLLFTQDGIIEKKGFLKKSKQIRNKKLGRLFLPEKWKYRETLFLSKQPPGQGAGRGGLSAVGIVTAGMRHRPRDTHVGGQKAAPFPSDMPVSPRVWAGSTWPFAPACLGIPGGGSRPASCLPQMCDRGQVKSTTVPRGR